MGQVIIAAYKSRFGDSLCIEDRNRNGYRAAGAKMDGTNKEVCKFILDADDLVEKIRDVEFDRGGDAS